MDERIIEKVKKLLAIANDKNDAESDAAMLMAQKLIAEYHLSEAAYTDKAADKVEETRVDIGYRCNGWKRRLSSVIASNFRCGTYYYGARAGRRGQVIVFIGEGPDARLALQIFNFAAETGKIRWNEYHLRGMSSTERETFLHAFVDGIKSRYEEQKQNNQQWGLVLAKPAGVTKAMSAIKLVCRPEHPRTSGYYSDARSSGYAAGRAFNSSAGVLA